MPDIEATTTDPVQTIHIKMKFRRDKAKAFLSLDASELHAYLRELGVTEVDGVFQDGPTSEYSTIDTYRTKISPKLLLKTGPQEVNLSEVFARPLALDHLSALADSADSIVRQVIDHYRPIEISVVIAGRKVA